MGLKATLFGCVRKNRLHRLIAVAVMILTAVSFVVSLNPVFAEAVLPKLEFEGDKYKAECAYSVVFTTASPIEGEQVCIYDSEDFIDAKQVSTFVKADKDTMDTKTFTVTCKTEGNIIPKGNYCVTQATLTELGHIDEQSPPAIITFYEPAQEKPSEADFSIDYINEKLNYGGAKNVEYSIDGIDGAGYLPLEASLDISPYISVKAQALIKVRTAAASERPPSEDIVLTIPKRPLPPEPPEMTVCDIKVIALNSTVGFEYKMNDGDWSENCVFKGLTADTEYLFFQRIKAVKGKSFITASSEALSAKTSKEKTISGVVTGAEALHEATIKRLKGASVQLRSGGNNIGAAVVTNEKGEYVIPVFANGYYTVTVKKSGYTTGEIQTFYHFGENIINKDIRLEKIADSGSGGDDSNGANKPGDDEKDIPPMKIWLNHSSVTGGIADGEKPSYKYKGKYIWEAE